MKKTLFDKVWDTHVVDTIQDGPQVLYIDKHLIHEVTSPQAFNELEERQIPVFRPQQILATADHNTPTLDQHLPVKDELSRKQLEQLSKNCNKNNITLYELGHKYNGIVHVMAPELGITQPGMTMVCGDSHTSTHGAFGTIAFGIGTSQVAQVFASQCLLLSKPNSLRVSVNGKLKNGVLPKDVILYIISKLGTNSGTGYFCEYAGDVFEKVAYWKTLPSDEGAAFDKEYFFDASDIEPMVTYGTNPGMGIKISETIPMNNDPSFLKSLQYMNFEAGKSLINTPINFVFIGSCTNSRIEDFRVAANYVKGKHKAKNVTAWLVPGSKQVETQIIEEGLKDIFNDAGFELRQPGCSACLAMNDDKIPQNEYCVSTSNRNFEGRQGQGSRTILSSPLVAAVTAIEGKIIDITKQLN